ncbi:MAG: hypothetical protein J7M16_00570 [Anaerolineae bacterium]|nr:hypothetical protein [Anaerolineae bacterium]
MTREIYPIANIRLPSLRRIIADDQQMTVIHLYVHYNTPPQGCQRFSRPAKRQWPAPVASQAGEWYNL